MVLSPMFRFVADSICLIATPARMTKRSRTLCTLSGDIAISIYRRWYLRTGLIPSDRLSTEDLGFLSGITTHRFSTIDDVYSDLQDEE
jgi:hypothetical protein